MNKIQFIEPIQTSGNYNTKVETHVTIKIFGEITLCKIQH